MGGGDGQTKAVTHLITSVCFNDWLGRDLGLAEASVSEYPKRLQANQSPRKDKAVGTVIFHYCEECCGS